MRLQNLHVAFQAHGLGQREYSVTLAANDGVVASVLVKLGGTATTGWGLTWHPPTSIPTSMWTRLEVTVDSSKLRCFVNGKLEGSADNTQPPLVASKSPLILGAMHLSPIDGVAQLGGFLVGALDHIEVWTTALSEDEIQHRWHHRITDATGVSLVAFLRCDEGRGLTASDASGKGSHGLLRSAIAAVGVDAAASVAANAPSWIISRAGVGDRLYTREDTAIVVFLNATDPLGRPLVARFSELPSNGATLVPLGSDGTTRLTPLQASALPVDLPLGPRLLVQPSHNTFNATTVLSYSAVVPEDGSVSQPVEGDATVVVLVEAVDNTPRVSFPDDIRLSLLDFRVDDLDVGEAGDEVEISVAVPEISHAVNALTLASTQALGFAAPRGQGDGIADKLIRFVGTMTNANLALESLSLDVETTANTVASFSVGVNDLGQTGQGGEMETGHQVAVGLRAGNVLRVQSAWPLSAPVEGGKFVLATLRNGHGLDTRCFFGQEPSRTTTAIRDDLIACEIPPAPGNATGRVSLRLSSDGEFFSNAIEFTFYRSPLLVEAVPSAAVTTGGTVIAVKGQGFRNSSRLRCMFGATALTRAEYVSPSEVRCMTPAYGEATDASIAVSNNGLHFSAMTAPFSFHRPVSLAYAVPSSGVASGGGKVAVHGTGFIPSHSLACKFGQYEVPAEYVAPTVVHCVAPRLHLAVGGALDEQSPRTSTIVALDVTNNGVDFSWATALTYSYVEQPEVESVSPPAGVQGGGTAVSVVGKGFASDEALYCEFSDPIAGDAIEVSAVVVDSEHLMCTTPPFPSPGLAVVKVLQGVSKTPAVSTVRFMFYRTPVVEAIHPDAGPASGGTTVTVVGQHFALVDNLVCNWGAERPVTVATWVSATIVICTTPSDAALAGELREGTQPFSLRGGDVGDFVSRPQLAFHFQGDTAAVHSVFPRTGTMAGGTPVVVLGTGFSRANAETCEFGGTAVPAQFINATHVQCTTPSRLDLVKAARSAHAVELVVSRNGVLASTTSATFRYMVPLTIDHVEPNFGSTRGGTQVTVHGTGFGGEAVCSFGGVVVPATVASDIRLTCSSPSAPAGDVLLGVGMHSSGTFTKGLGFHFVEGAVLESLSPSIGSTTGGSQITLHGSGFVKSAEQTCLFASANDLGESTMLSTKATWLSNDAVACVTPPMPGPMKAAVSVSVNGVDSSMNSLSFEFYDSERVDEVFPTNGPTTGGTKVVIHGANFVNATSLVCCFTSCSEVQVPAVFISSTQVSCHTPGWSMMTVSVLVSNNGVDNPTSAATTKFSFLAPLVVTAVSPSTASLGEPTTVHVTGAGFVSDSGLECIFANGGLLVHATAQAVSASAVRCVLPQNAVTTPGSIAVRLSNNHGLDMSTTSATITLVDGITHATVFPNHGSVSGGTVVSVSLASTEGRELPLSGWTCVFGDLVAAAGWISSTVVECKSPVSTSAVAATVSLKLAHDGQDKVVGLKFHYLPAITVENVVPRAARPLVQKVVSVLGSGFTSNVAPLCKFGEAAASPGVFMTEMEIHCPVPILGPGPVLVSLSFNGVDFVNDGVEFTFLPSVVVDSVHPKSGPTSGNTVVTLEGSGFAQGLACSFGDHSTPVLARVLSSTTATCNSPAHAAGVVSVAVTYEGAPTVGSAQQFTFHDAVIITGVSPSSGSEDGGTAVLVQGSNFLLSRDLACMFGDTPAASVQWISTTLVVCTSPVHRPSTQTIRVSNNGENFTSDAQASAGTTFMFVQRVQLTSASPARSSVAGGETVVVTGEGFRVGSPWVCVFGEATTRALVAETSKLECLTPASPSGMTTLRVLDEDGVPQGTPECSTLQFEFVADTVVHSVIPSSGAPGGGTPVHVFGVGFIDSDDLACRFGSQVTVPALYLSHFEIQCAVPPKSQAASEGDDTVVVRASNNGLHFSPAGPLFRYQSTPVVSALFPTHGSESGGTPVLVSGSWFTLGTALACRFGVGQPTPAVWVSPTAVQCSAPKRSPGPVAVEVSNNGVDFSNNLRVFTFTGEAHLAWVVPAASMVGGGTVVTVHGTGFQRSLSARCRFGAIETSHIHFVSNTLVECIAPPHEPGVVAVSVSFNGVDFVNDGVEFTFLPSVVVDSVHPKSGPTSGNTVVTLEGSGFAQGLACSFGDHSTPVLARVLSSTTATCNSPAHAAGVVSVAVTYEGAPTVGSAQQFTFHDAVIITGVSPSSGSEDGGTAVLVQGSNFLLSRDLACMFGDTPAASVQWISTTLVVCTSPVHRPSTQTIRVSNNGNDDPTSAGGSAAYTFAARPRIASIDPSSGPNAGGSLVVVTGEGFQEATPWHCVFGTSYAMAAYKNSTTLECVAPAATQSGVVPFTVVPGGPEALPAHAHVEGSLSFEYTSRAVVVGISPHIGSALGGTYVVVSGFGFTGALKCLFGNVLVSGIPISDTNVACVSPRVESNVTTPVRVSSDGGQSFSAEAVPFRYREPPSVVSVHPPRLATAVSSQVVVTATNLPAVGHVWCGFYADDEQHPLLVSEATRVGSQAVVCASPASSPRNADVRLTLNEVEFGAGVDVAFSDAEGSAVAIPASAPSVGGGVVNLYRVPGGTADALACVFGSGEKAHAVPAVSTHGSLQCAIPAFEAGSTTLSVVAATSGNELVSTPFVFYPQRPILTVSPRNGPARGGTRITITGFSQQERPAYCKFVEADGQFVPETQALSLSSDAVACVVPALPAGPREVTVEVLDRERLFIGSARFVVTNSPTVHSVVPSVGPDIGGTMVHVQGSGFFNAPGLACKFGDGTDFAVAKFVSSTSVQCIVPTKSSRSTLVAVAVTMNGIDFSHDGPEFEYLPIGTLNHVEPQSGPQRGGFVVVVHGSNFDSRLGSWTCRFGSANEVVATKVGTTALACKVPASNTPGQVSLIIGVMGTGIQLRVDGGFNYLPHIVVSRLNPPMGPVSGGTTLLVEGQGFSGASMLYCGFGPGKSVNGMDHVVVARQLSATLLECVTPPALTKHTSPTSVSFELSADGEVFSSTGVQFTYVPLPSVSRLQPHIVSEVGGATITLVGTALPRTAQVLCRFGIHSPEPLTWLSNNLATCLAPAASPGFVDLFLSFNGMDWMPTGAQLQYVPQFHISDIHPLRASTDGGTRVRLSGAGFAAVAAQHGTDSAGLLCDFNGEFVAATVVTGTGTEAGGVVECTTPPHAAGSVDVAVMTQDLRMRSNHIAFTYAGMPVPTTLDPLVGSELGGTALRVGLRGASTGTPNCVFGGVVHVPAAWENEQTLSCVVPALRTLRAANAILTPTAFMNDEAGWAVTVELSVNGIDVTREGLSFRFYPELSVQRVLPHLGSTAGGTVVTVSGSGFRDTESLACRFGFVLVEATYVSPSTAQCVSPPATPGPVSVFLSVNGVDFVSPPINATASSERAGQFTYVHPHTVLSVEPRFGPESGGTILRITGSGFSSGDNHGGATTVCDFLGIFRPALVLDDTQIACVAPPLVMIRAASITSRVQVRVSLNGGVDWSDGAIEFAYVAAFGVVAPGVVTPTSLPSDNQTHEVRAVVQWPSLDFVDADVVSEWACRFGASAAHSAHRVESWGSQVTVVCPVTCTDVATEDLQVSPNGGFDWLVVAQLECTPVMSASAKPLEPAIGFATGGTIVSLPVANVPPQPFAIDVEFDGEVATVLDRVEGALLVISPAHTPGRSLLHNESGVDVRIATDSHTVVLPKAFLYVPTATVASMFPESGPRIGGTFVTFTGTNLNATSHCKCRFGSVEVPATVASSEAMQCTTPAMDNVGSVTVVLLIGNDLVQVVQPFVFLPPLELYGLVPGFVSPLGSTVVTIWGVGFIVDGGMALCAFDSSEHVARVHATVLSSTVVECASPPLAVVGKTVSVTVSMDGGVHWSSPEGRALQVQVLPLATTLSVTPGFGAASGGTVVTVRGNNFVQSAALKCLIGTHAVQAVYHSPRRVDCSIPANRHAGAVQVYISNDGNALIEGGGATFVYTQTPHIMSISPTRGPSRGGVLVSVVVQNAPDSSFIEPTRLTCRFGESVLVPATFTVDGLTCEAPTMGQIGGAHGMSTSVSVAVSFNGIDYYVLEDAFTYMGQVFVSALTPTAGSHAGGTVLHVHGMNFPDANKLACSFSNPAWSATTQARWYSNGHASCVTPRSPGVDFDVAFVQVQLTVNGKAVGNHVQYQFLPEIVVHNVEPSSLPENGGRVAVFGSNFGVHHTLECMIGDSSPSVATFVGHDQIQCPVPPLPPSPASSSGYTVSISANGFADRTIATTRLVVTPALTVASLNPVAGSVRGGTLVTFDGTGFLSASGLECVFHAPKLSPVSVPADVMSHAMAACAAPQSPTGTAIEVDVFLVANQSGLVSAGKFRFVELPHVDEIYPASASTSGGTPISITGHGFDTHLDNYCMFGVDIVKATVVAATHVVCVSPNYAAEGTVRLAVSSDPSHFEGGVQFLFTHPVEISKEPVPQVVRETGSELITVVGRNFVDLPTVTCRFGRDHDVRAWFQSPTEVSCQPPEGLLGLFALSVSMNGVDFVQAPGGVVFQPSATLVAVSPTSGPISGGTTIIANGTNFHLAHVDGVQCRFIRSGTPSGNDNGAQQSRLAMVEAFDVQPTSLKCTTPPAASGIVAVDVIVRGRGMDMLAGSGGVFTYIPTPNLDRVLPSFGGQRGGTVIHVFGEGMDISLFCWMGGERFSVARFVSHTEVVCTMPPLSSLHAQRAFTHTSERVGLPTTSLHNSSLVKVELGTDSAVTSSTGVAYRYIPDPTVLGVSPAVVPTTGGVELRVRGSSFPHTEALQCVLGAGGVLPARWVSDSLVSCMVPAMEPGLLPIRISTNGVDLYGGHDVAVLAVPERSVASISPKRGPTHGGSTVVVDGSGFWGTDGMVPFCHFDDVAVAATVVSDSQLECQLPTWHAPETVAVSVHARLPYSGHSVKLEGAPLAFVFEEGPQAVALDPTWGPASGGTVLQVSGMFFKLTDALSVRLRHTTGVQYITPTWKSDKLLEVVLPESLLGPSSRSIVAMDVSNNGADFSNSGLLFSFEPRPAVVSVEPEVTAPSGGTIVTVRGHNFAPDRTGHVVCRVGGGEAIPATWDSVTQVSFQAPPKAPGGYVVEISTNSGLDWSSSLATLEYRQPIVIEQLHPESGPVRGKTAINVSGTGFRPSDRLSCFFTGPPELEPARGVEAVASVTSDTQLICHSPAWLDSRGGDATVTVAPTREGPTQWGLSFRETGGNVLAYTYYPNEVVAELSPNRGPANGVTQVYVHGFNFRQSTTLSCRVSPVLDAGSIPSASIAHDTLAVWDDPTQVRCNIPKLPAGRVTIELANNGVDFTINERVFTLYEPVQVKRVDPATGPEAGGVMVYVHGSGFVDSLDLVCRFGVGAPVAADFVSTKLVVCPAPAKGSTGVVFVDVSVNGVDWSLSTAQFEYLTTAVVHRVSPRHGPVRGGTRLQVFGANFRRDTHLFCRFAWKDIVPATFVRHDQVECVVPPFSGEVSRVVPVEVTDLRVDVNESQTGASQLVWREAVTLYQRDDSPSVVFEYVPEIHLTSIAPLVGPSTGFDVMIQGSAFLQLEESLRCRFNFGDGHKTVVQARWLGSTLLACKAPSVPNMWAHSSVPGELMTAAVDVTGNLVDYSTDSLQLSFHTPVHVSSLTPVRGDVGGGTHVHVRGTGFVDTDELQCRVNNVTVPAVYRSPDHLECTMPPGISQLEVQHVDISVQPHEHEVQEVVATAAPGGNEVQTLDIASVGYQGEVQRVVVDVARSPLDVVEVQRVTLDVVHVSEVQRLSTAARGSQPPVVDVSIHWTGVGVASGTWFIEVGGVPTVSLEYNASAEVVENAVEALPNTGDVAVSRADSGSNGGHTWTLQMNEIFL